MGEHLLLCQIRNCIRAWLSHAARSSLIMNNNSYMHGFLFYTEEKYWGFFNITLFFYFKHESMSLFTYIHETTKLIFLIENCKNQAYKSTAIWQYHTSNNDSTYRGETEIWSDLRSPFGMWSEIISVSWDAWLEFTH